MSEIILNAIIDTIIILFIILVLFINAVLLVLISGLFPFGCIISYIIMILEVAIFVEWVFS